MKLNKFDYMFLMGAWPGPYGAAYNSVMEDCKEAGLFNGWIHNYPNLTQKGQKALYEYETTEKT